MKPRNARAVNPGEARWKEALEALGIPAAIQLPLADRLRTMAEAARRLRGTGGGPSSPNDSGGMIISQS